MGIARLAGISRENELDEKLKSCTEIEQKIGKLLEDLVIVGSWRSWGAAVERKGQTGQKCKTKRRRMKS